MARATGAMPPSGAAAACASSGRYQAGRSAGRGVARVSAVRDGRAALAQPHAGGRIDPIGRVNAFATDGPRRVC